MILKAAFMFIAPNVNPEKHKSIVKTEAVHLITVGVNSYESAEEQARKLVEGGVTVIELCGGFGLRGTRKISDAVQGKALIGVVKFDVHPGSGHTRGDDWFSRRRLSSVVL